MNLIKISTFILLIISPLFCISQGGEEWYRQEKPKYATGADRKHRNCRDEYGRKQGIHKLYSPQGILLWEIEYVNDKKHGRCAKYFAMNGKLREESNYFDGRLEGEYKKMYSTGNTNIEGEFLDGLRHGHWIKYSNLTTEVLWEGDYNIGKKTGQWIYNNSKGQIKAKGNYVYDKKDGTWEYYDAEGKVAYTKTYKNGEEISTSTTTPTKETSTGGK